MKVTTSCFGRFHVFDQARELEQLGVLHRLICAYPRYLTRRWNIPDSKVISLLANGIIGASVASIGPRLPAHIADRLTRSVHGNYSRRLSRYVPIESDAFIGLSSFSLEALIRAKQEGVLAVVEHGSLHERLVGRLLQEEIERWELRAEIRWPLPWLIDKEDREFKEADCIVVLSQCAKRSLVNEGIPEEKIFINNCGVDFTGFFPGKKSDDVFRIIQCGSLIPCKGVQYLLKAFSELNLPKAELWFIGAGLHNSFLKPVIDRYAADHVVFKGPFPQAGLQPLYAQGSVFVLASVADGFGMVVPQAMACGLPVIVTENTGAADIVTHGENGFVVPIRDVEALKEKLLFLYENPNVREDMALSAAETSRRDLSWKHYGQRLVTELGRRLATRSSSPNVRS